MPMPGTSSRGRSPLNSVSLSFAKEAYERNLLAIVLDGEVLASANDSASIAAIEEGVNLEVVDLDLNTRLDRAVVSVLGGEGQVGGSDSARGREVVGIVKGRHPEDCCVKCFEKLEVCIVMRIVDDD